MGCSQSKSAGVVTVTDSPPEGMKTPKSQSSGHVLNANSPKDSSPVGFKSEAVKETVNGGYVAANLENGFEGYASGASTPDHHSDEDNESDHSSGHSHPKFQRKMSNPKLLTLSTSAIGLDEMIEDRKNEGGLRQNVVNIEVPFGKPIEEVYEGIHSGHILGSGVSGIVRLVTHKATSIKYAVKVLDLRLVNTIEGLTQLQEEIFIMCQLDHPNIVRLREVYESQSEIYLVQELCQGGELFDRLDEQPDYHYTEAECARLVKQMLSAVRYLHSNGIIHRDLKLENFLFSSKAKDSELKMIDFGLSKHFHYGEVLSQPVGTPYTVAPEVIRGTYDERCDVWAIGVISFLLLSGDPPFGGCGGPEPLMMVRSNILRGAYAFEPEEIWANVSDLARQFIKDMLKTDPKDRPTARNAQQHAWLQEWASRSRTGKDNILNPEVVKALVNFKEFSDMRKLLCEVLSFMLLPYQIKELRREFEKMDTDGSGEISLSALKTVLVTNAGAGSLGALTEEEVEDIFNAMRVRKTDKRIHWHEFIAAGLSQCQVDDRNLRLAFDRLDSGHKGYVILDDIMDLMGSDAALSEDDMCRMWGDSIKTGKGQHARITYDDFLLLMKGQTKESPSHELNRELENSASALVGATRLDVVSESDIACEESSVKSDEASTTMANDDTADGTIVPPAMPAVSLDHSPLGVPLLQPSQSAPNTPEDHRRTLDMEMRIDSLLCSDADDDHIFSSGPGVPGSSASLTPPMSPSRGIQDYCTPGAQRRSFVELKELKSSNLDIPGLPSFRPSGGLEKPSIYTRGRSRSVGDDHDTPEKTSVRDIDESNKLSVVAEVAEAVHDLTLPETNHSHTSININGIKDDQSKSNLVVNRKLYRAHRQTRLAILEASKRFEEQQAEHAKEIIMAARDDDDRHGMIQAGLVMRHGIKKQVSSKAIRALLEQNRTQQRVLVEKANRRGGRGRRSRKKTNSDMSGMLGSTGADDFGAIVRKASLEQSIPEDSTKMNEDILMYEDMSPEQEAEEAGEVDLPDLSQLRAATVPGEFRKTSDPFGKQGQYGALASGK